MIIARFKLNFHTFNDVILFMRIFFWISLIALIVKLLSIPKMLSFLMPATSMGPQASGQRELIGKVTKYTDFILGCNWWIYRMNCLKRALVIFRILRFYGINVQICLGVRKNRFAPAAGPEAYLQGHAWLTINGKPFLEDRRSMTTAYTPVFSFPREDGTTYAETV